MSYWKPGSAKGGGSTATTPSASSKSLGGDRDKGKNVVTPGAKPTGLDEASPVLSKSVLSMKVSVVLHKICMNIYVTLV